MGRLRSQINHGPTQLDGIQLGDPVITRADGTPFQDGDNIADLVFAWDDHRIPDGTIDALGKVTLDPEVRPGRLA